MIQLLLKTTGGILLLAFGFYLAFLYVSGIDSGSTPLLLIPAILLIIAGIFLLLRAGESNASVIVTGKVTIDETKDTLSNTLNKNNEIVSKWAKTSQLKDQLKVMQTAAEAGESTE